MSKINIEITNSFLSQIRKQNLEVFISTQKIRKLDIKIREEADYIYTCERFAKVKNKFEKIEHNQNLSKDIPIVVKVNMLRTYNNESTDYFFIGNKYFNMYNTFEIIKIKGVDI